MASNKGTECASVFKNCESVVLLILFSLGPIHTHSFWLIHTEALYRADPGAQICRLESRSVPTDTSRNNDVVITSKWRQFEIITSNDVVLTLQRRYYYAMWSAKCNARCQTTWVRDAALPYVQINTNCSYSRLPPLKDYNIRLGNYQM